MGYYSDVYLVLNEKTHEQLQEKLTEFITSVKDYCNTSIKDLLWGLKIEVFKKEKENIYLYRWEHIKWYIGDKKNYPVVFITEESMNEFNGKDFFFLRIGEDWFDIETKGCFDYCFSPYKEMFANVLNYNNKNNS